MRIGTKVFVFKTSTKPTQPLVFMQGGTITGKGEAKGWYSVKLDMGDSLEATPKIPVRSLQAGWFVIVPTLSPASTTPKT